MSLPPIAAAALGILLLGAGSTQRAKQKPKTQPRLPHAARHAHGRPRPREPLLPAEANGALSPAACLAELARRHVGFVREEPKRGVQIPVRLTGALGGVLYRTDFSDAARRNTPFEIFDCRLVLSLHDFSRVLQTHGIAEVRIFSAWRPPSASWPMQQWGRRHPGALALDVREFRRANGEVLNVLEHFHGTPEATLCGAAATLPVPDAPEARELRQIACAAVDAHLFNSVLTPDYNEAHKDHFHLELTPDVDWFIVR